MLIATQPRSLHRPSQSQSDYTNATIAKSPLLSGARACWSEGLASDGICRRLAQCTVGVVLQSMASSYCVDEPFSRVDLGARFGSF
jgi:hypothetical protein